MSEVKDARTEDGYTNIVCPSCNNARLKESMIQEDGIDYAVMACPSCGWWR